MLNTPVHSIEGTVRSARHLKRVTLVNKLILASHWRRRALLVIDLRKICWPQSNGEGNRVVALSVRKTDLRGNELVEDFLATLYLDDRRLLHWIAMLIEGNIT